MKDGKKKNLMRKGKLINAMGVYGGNGPATNTAACSRSALNIKNDHQVLFDGLILIRL
jgi:hypothetical protein